jgi:hypothetical protein
MNTILLFFLHFPLQYSFKKNTYDSLCFRFLASNDHPHFNFTSKQSKLKDKLAGNMEHVPVQLVALCYDVTSPKSYEAALDFAQTLPLRHRKFFVCLIGLKVIRFFC